jgi:hypothetical protein
MRWEIINKLIKDNNYKSYLEIGYYKGWSFDQVNCERKIAVDPNPSKTPQQEAMNIGEFDGEVLKQYSDEYFAQSIPQIKHNIIFIDGLHEAEQVSRDIKNALTHLAEGGAIVLHDCNPPEYAHTTTGINGCWTGDTYKAVLRFQSENIFGTYNYKTIDTDWGCGIITKNNIVIEDMPEFSYNKAIQDWNYFSENRTKLLNLVNYEEWKKS